MTGPGRAAVDPERIRRAPLLVAHRGDHRVATENTVAAFRAAMAAGCDGAELDVRCSGDGVAIVLHDATLDRVQGRPERAGDLTAAALARAGVPTLAAVLRAMPAPFLVDVELKGRDAVAPAMGAIEEVRGPDAPGVVISSFGRATLADMAALRPRWPRWLISTRRADAGSAVELGCAAIALRTDALDEALVRAVHGRGLEVVAWTIRDRAGRDAMAALGVDVICAEGSALDR